MNSELSSNPAQIPQCPARTQRFLPAACALYAALVIVYWFCNRFIADRWWPGTWILFAPRWPWLAPALVLAYFARRRKWLWIAPLFTGVFVIGPLMGFNVPWHRLANTSPTGQAIRILTCNVHRQELDIARLDSYALEMKPDIIALQDYSGWDTSGVINTGWHTQRIREIFLGSRYPIIRAQSLHLEAIPGKDDVEMPRYAGSAVCFDLQTPAGIVHFLDLHLASPHTGLTAFATHPGLGVWKLKNNATRRVNESLIVTQFVGTLSGPVILAGDFNMLSENPTFQQYFGQYPDAFETTGWGYGYTHYSPVSQLRIDHVLMGAMIDCKSTQIGPNCGTPHRPLVADLVLRADR